jgi:Uma2 family endonuclease
MQREIREILMTEEEYIAFEQASDARHEYINGKLIAMPGESTANNEIALNIAMLLKGQLKGKKFFLYAHDVKLKLPTEKSYYYPDIFVTEQPPATDKYVVETAVLIVEILSPTTRHFDMFDKYLQYRKIPDLRYYLLVEPSKKLITVCEKNDAGEWSTEVYDANDGIISLKFLELELNAGLVF